MKILNKTPDFQIKLSQNLFDAVRMHKGPAGNQLPYLDELLKKGANINITNPYINGDSPLLLAANFQVMEMVIGLIQRGADWNIKNSKNLTFFEYLSEKNKKTIKEMFPIEYEEYLLNQVATIYNL